MPTFYDRFRECAERWPDKIALENQRPDRTESYTHAQVRRSAESVGHWLADRGCGPRTRCAILADNHPRWVMAYLGIIAAGCTTVPLDTALHPDQIAKLLLDSGAAVLFCGGKYFAAVGAAIGGMAIQIVLTDDSVGEGARAGATARIEEPGPTQAASDLDTIFAVGTNALETLKIYAERDILGHVRHVAPLFQKRLAALGDHPLVGEAVGVGLIGVGYAYQKLQRVSPA